ncbi:peptidylprolyl isomerase [Sedimentitalea nanhaiensis]|uniref:Parvulin-like PPIase n=1 Tax=Sedimentitalea nanhaiensis TaxID=999627 RepID=A0A1I7C9C9_9RHOB|nr:peptidylprolyl isomerase [Sedimentitalea nanhaiensis]SFT95994.1 peptidyl-prolyl cis-trans isomerase C [Sedimentitalea nanhaiensis]
MPKHLTFLSVVALSAALGLPVFAADAPTADTVVARINDQEITIGHMIVARATLPQQYQQMPADMLYNAILEQLIQQSALVQSRTGDVPQQVTIALENERRSLLAADAIETFMQGVGSEEEIRAAYEAKYADGFGETEYDASHILVETQEEAAAIKADLDGGADFAETAKIKSTGPSGPNGGALGWFGEGAMVPEFQEAVVALQPGQISDPVQTKFGWHIIKLNDSRNKAAPEFADVRDELLAKLRQDAVESQIEDLTRKATVERPTIDGLQPDILQNFELLGN